MATVRSPRFRIHGGNLRLIHPNLWNDLTLYYDKEVLKGWLHIDTAILQDEHAAELVAAVPLLAKMKNPDDVMAANHDFNEAQLAVATQEAEVEAKRKAIEDGGHAQLAAYQKVGLLDTQRNADIIRDAINRRDKGMFTAISVRNAVEGERHQLAWGKVEARAVTAPPQPQVELLPNGEPALPLDANVYQMRKASKEQLQDLSRRRSEGQSRPGWSSARF